MSGRSGLKTGTSDTRGIGRGETSAPRLARPHLSPRERAVLTLLAHGSATEEIAAELHLSPHTVRSHVRAALRKLSARTRTHAVAIALAEHLIDF